ncbi:hypothetical protein GN956_G18841 [Arapaima gigas]
MTPKASRKGSCAATITTVVQMQGVQQKQHLCPAERHQCGTRKREACSVPSQRPSATCGPILKMHVYIPEQWQKDPDPDANFSTAN